MPMDLAKLRERVLRRKAAMVAERADYEPIWKDVANGISPIKSRFLFGDNRTSRRNLGNSKVLDTHANWCWRVLTAGMTSGLTSASRPWFVLSTEDPGLREFQKVKLWLADTQERMYSAFARSGFYEASKTGYGEMGMFGQEACIMDENREHGAVCYPMTAGEFYIGLDYCNRPNTLLRRCDMTVIQLYDRFVKGNAEAILPKAIRDQYTAGDYNVSHEVWHIIEPNFEAEPTKIDKLNMKFRSLYWLAGSEEPGKEFLEVSGYREQPFWAPRWDVTSSDTYGTCPGIDTLGDNREVQMTTLRKGQARDFVVKPALRAPYALQNAQKALLPGGVSYMAAVDKDAFGPLWTVDYRVIDVLRAEQSELHQSQERGWYVDLFLAVMQMEGVQPRNVEEIMARQDEKMTQLGPVIERALNEKLRVAIDRMFGIMMRTGQLMPPPEELAGVDIKVEFVSILAVAQKAAGIRAMERFSGFVGNLAGVYPAVLDKMDPDQAVDQYAELTGVHPSLVVPDDVVAEKRKARAQQEQAAAAAQNAAVAMPAAKDGATAAKLLSETRVNPEGETALARMFG